MTEIDLDALEATARTQAAAYSKMLELDGGVGLLGVRHPDMFEDMMAWDGSSENDHADTVLALIARLREAEAVIDAILDYDGPEAADMRNIALAYKTTKTEGE